MSELQRQVITDGPLPKHQQLRDLIVQLAVPGQAIPSERELMVTYGVSRGTVRKAIEVLVGQGLLKRTLGKGTFAVQPRLETRLHLASFSQDMRQRGLIPSTRLLGVTRQHPDLRVAEALGLAERDQAWRVQRVRLANDQPIAVEDGWYPAAALPDLDQQDLASGSLYQILGSEYGLWIDGAEQTLWAETADAPLARQLSAPLHTPLLVFRRTSTASGRPIEHVVSHYRGDRYQVHMSLSRDELPAVARNEGNIQ
ncbi:MAG: GntR family transcriptional regulator [Micropruina sp.]|nr:GntR family transcriptional regulator [Micropruina sp.]